MRVKSYTTKAANFGRLGKIKVGELVPMQDGKERPASTDYFVFTSNVSRRIQKIQALLMGIPENATAGKIVVIPCTFASDNEGEVCSQFLELRNKAGQVVAKGDGETFFESGEDGYVLKTPADPEQYMGALAAKSPGVTGWRECLVLRVVVLGFDELGTWEFRTYGKDTTIPSIVATFDGIKALAGRVRGVPFRLTVDKQKSNRAGVNRQYPVVNLFCDFSPEGLDNIRSLGAQLTGIITPAKLQAATENEVPALPSGLALPYRPAQGQESPTLFTPAPDPDKQAEQVPEYHFSPEELAEQYLDNFAPKTASDFTEIAVGILSNKLFNTEEKSATAKKLGEIATSAGFKWDPIARQYYQKA